ncbi:hypothetical protein D7X94_03840 [Acutalibacter sp. 1XD8-33]|uniref:hypothetical protein n=1 Tax=Acutalibacter sp. 1XD8-33 TaxID=2320081 RepID=UPI000EA0D214|nr:hypothetical protein [Acutalibacter sp. 1XD8-33]RKJ41430.1 hypothetical protein D7X94_03840 [Acutalibacter sp. 1XD8-33]
MICPNCGRNIPDGTVCPCTLEAPPPLLSDNPAVNVVKTIGSSPLFLTMAILFSASALLTVFSSMGLSDALSNIYYYAYAYGLYDYIDSIANMLDMIRATSVANAIIGSIPAILLAVAMWIHFVTCRNRMSGNISTAGLTICKVFRYIYMVALCLCAFLVLAGIALVLIVVLSEGVPPMAFAGSEDEVLLSIIVIMAIVTLVCIFAFVLGITYQASLIRMINRTKTVAQSGMADDRVSSYLVGMTYFVAVCTLISGVFALFTAPISAVGTLCQGSALILAAVLLGRYRTAMNQVLFPPVQPAVPPMYADLFPGQQPQQAGPDGQPVPQDPADGFQQPPQQ